LKIRSLLLGSFIAATSLVVSASATLAARAYAIVDSQTGYILAQQSGTEKRQVGSLTKIATACVALDWAEHRHGDLGRVVTIPPEAMVPGENSVGFQPGDQVALRDLLYAALVQSDNVAATALAYHIGGDLQSTLGATTSGGPIETFVTQMNALAGTLKMQRTHFLNPHGGDDKTQPYSTALDMARLTRYAMNKAAFRFYVSQRERQINWSSAGKKRSYVLRNTNELLGQNGIDGVKTGQTAKAGGCLALSANRQAEIRQDGRTTYVTPRHLIVIVLGSADRFGEGSGLLASGWQMYDQWAAGGRQVQPSRML
jgi:D-alanyl-D-alanine carboxypeptidase